MGLFSRCSSFSGAIPSSENLIRTRHTPAKTRFTYAWGHVHDYIDPYNAEIFMYINHGDHRVFSIINRRLRYERVYLPLFKVADTPFHI